MLEYWFMKKLLAITVLGLMFSLNFASSSHSTERNWKKHWKPKIGMNFKEFAAMNKKAKGLSGNHKYRLEFLHGNSWVKVSHIVESKRGYSDTPKLVAERYSGKAMPNIIIARANNIKGNAFEWNGLFDTKNYVSDGTLYYFKFNTNAPEDSNLIKIDKGEFLKGHNIEVVKKIEAEENKKEERRKRQAEERRKKEEAEKPKTVAKQPGTTVGEIDCHATLKKTELKIKGFDRTDSYQMRFIFREGTLGSSNKIQLWGTVVSFDWATRFFTYTKPDPNTDFCKVSIYVEAKGSGHLNINFKNSKLEISFPGLGLQTVDIISPSSNQFVYKTP